MGFQVHVDQIFMLWMHLLGQGSHLGLCAGLSGHGTGIRIKQAIVCIRILEQNDRPSKQPPTSKQPSVDHVLLRRLPRASDNPAQLPEYWPCVLHLPSSGYWTNDDAMRYQAINRRGRCQSRFISAQARVIRYLYPAATMMLDMRNCMQRLAVVIHQWSRLRVVAASNGKSSDAGCMKRWF